jgi:ATP-binding protein involved in chromosome partitioning
VVADRLAGVRRIVAVGGSKGGIGKSVISTLTALAAADRGIAAGLFDLDFTSPTDHTILGADRGFPVEEYGVEPHPVCGIGMMSVAFLSGKAPAPLRGEDATNALLELLAITRWGERDLLVLDLPPGLGDTTLDLIRLVPGARHLLVAAGSRLVLGSVERALGLLAGIGVPLLGIVENLAPQDGGSRAVRELADRFGAAHLGAVPFDASLEEALGDPELLRATDAYRAVDGIVASLLS